MDQEFVIPLNIDDLLHNASPLYVVSEIASLRELPTKILMSRKAVSNNGCFFILDHFDTLYSYLHHAKELDVKDMVAVLHQSISGMEHLSSCLPSILDEDEMHPDQRKKFQNIAKMTMFIFGHVIKFIEDKRLGKEMLFDLKGRKKTAKSTSCQAEWDDDRNQSLFALYTLLQQPLQKLWSPPVVEEEFVSLAANVCYKFLEDPIISSVKMKSMRESIFQILGTLVSKFQHGLSCTVKLAQLLKIYEHLYTPLAECVIVLVKDYGCRGFLREVVREISESDSVYEATGAKAFAAFLTEVGKNASDLVLPIMNLLLPHLNNDPYTMRNCVLDIMGELLVQNLCSESMDDSSREMRNTFLDHLQDHFLDTNAYVRSKALKVWQHLAQEKAIPLSRMSGLIRDVISRLGDVSWTVVKSAIQLVKTILENNPYGAKMDLKTLRDKLQMEDQSLKKLEEKACNLESMTQAQRWTFLEPSITLVFERALQSNNHEEKDSEVSEEPPMNATEMTETLKRIRACVDKKEFEEALKLVRQTENMLPGASEARKDKGLEWQVDFFIRLVKKIYVEMDEEENDEDKENIENVPDENKKDSKKGKKRRLQDLHPSEEDGKPTESEAVKAAVSQARVVQYLKDCISFVEAVDEAIAIITTLLHSRQAPVIQDTIDFLTTASLFGFEQSKTGIKQMLLLVWSSEASVKEAVATAYKTLFIDTHPDLPIRAQAVEIVRNLTNLLATLGANERASLEVLVMDWVSSGALDKSCIQVMWERFSQTLKETTPDESRAALQLLAMVAASKVQTVQTNVEVLVKVGFGEKGKRSTALIKDTCWALLKLVPNGRVTSDDEPLRFERDHLMFETLVDILTERFLSIDYEEYLSVAEAALDVIYLLSENPDITAQELLRNVIDQLKSNGSSEEIITPAHIPTELLRRLIFYIGHIAYRQWIHLDKYIFRELKRRNRLREKFAEESKDRETKANVKKSKSKSKKGDQDNHDSSLQTSMLSASHILKEKQEADEELGADIAADDAEAEYINNICESEILSKESMLGQLSEMVVAVCANPQKYVGCQLQATSSLALTKLMLVSSDFCETNLQLVFTMMEKSSVPQIRSNLVYAMGDLSNRFPNLIEPWTKHFYTRLHDTSSRVRLDTILVLKHLITNEMMKVRGQISDLALCIVDPEFQISCMASSLFEELSKKGNTLYNVMPDIISRLSNPSTEVAEDKFRTIMKFLMQLIQKDRQMESLVDKLCQRFRASTHEKQWCYLAYCLGLMQYSDRSLRRLLENAPCYAEKLTVPMVYETFCDIIQQARKTQKPERQLIVEELESKIKECLLKGLPEGDVAKIESGTAESQDSEDGVSNRKGSRSTQARRRQTVSRTPARSGGRGRPGRGRTTRRHRKFSSSSEGESDSSSSSDNVFIGKGSSRKKN